MLRYVVANIRNQVMEAIVKDRTGSLRKIRYTWKTKDAALPPANWYEIINGEVDYQLEQEHRGGLPE